MSDFFTPENKGKFQYNNLVAFRADTVFAIFLEGNLERFYPVHLFIDERSGMGTFFEPHSINKPVHWSASMLNMFNVSMKTFGINVLGLRCEVADNNVRTFLQLEQRIGEHQYATEIEVTGQDAAIMSKVHKKPILMTEEAAKAMGEPIPTERRLTPQDAAAYASERMERFINDNPTVTSYQ